MFAKIVLLVGFLHSANLQSLPCCLPGQWNSVMQVSEATITPQYQKVQLGKKIIWMDYINQRQAIESVYEDGSSSKTIDDFNRMIKYDIEDGKCTASKENVKMAPKCIPVTARLIASSYIGAGYNKISYDTWRYFLPGYNINVTVSVSQSTCVPLSEDVVSRTEDYNFTMMAVFTSFVSKIEDPSVFVPPSWCPHSVEQGSDSNTKDFIKDNRT